MTIDISLVGHYTQDTIITADGKKYERQGGPPSHMKPFLKAAGVNFRIVSKIGKDFKYTENLHNPVKICDNPTTAWLGDYSKGERQMKFLSVCDAIKPEDIDHESVISIACGVANEILPETVKKMRANSKYLLCDIQGFCRRVDNDKNIYHTDPMKAWFRDYVHYFDFIKMSSSEAKTVDVEAMRKKTTVIITNGSEGCTIITRDKKIDVPGFRAEVIDPTGSGDAFLAGFAFGLLRGKTIKESARIGNYFGSLAVKHIGIANITKNDLQKINL
jgi:1D-myo-inositol 3-kinase